MTAETDSQVKHIANDTKRKELVPIVLSCLALAVSFISLYFSQLHPADIYFFAGERVNIVRFDPGNYGISVSVAITNDGAKSATITKLALLIKPPNEKEYLLEPTVYLKAPFRLDKHGNYPIESISVPFNLAPKESVVKKIVFRSSLVNPNEFQITKPGKYEMTLLGWVDDTETPKNYCQISTKIIEPNIKALDKRNLEVTFIESKFEKWTARHLTMNDYNEIDI
ncbi:MAG: hypothetical protein ACETWQ_09605 [Phycisphaerae bacterium]